MPEPILMIEDDARLADMVKEYLAEFGFVVSIAATGEQGIAAVKTGKFKALILDLMLPDMDGFEVFRAIPKELELPVIMLTAKGDPLDRIIGLELGADDYLPKPFEPRELLARLKSIKRRSTHGTGADTLSFGRLVIDCDSMEVRLDGNHCDLTGYQFRILETLARGAGRVMSRDHLMNQLQGHNIEQYDRSIDVHISRIRSVIEDDPRKPKRLLTIRGFGYRFVREQD